MILLIDNYDSFTYNLVQYLSEVSSARDEIRVIRNDALSCDQIEMLAPSRIVISPGPCTPDESGISLEVVERFHRSIPILGVCLGHQAIGQAFGGKIIRAAVPVHGKVSEITHDGSGIFTSVPSTCSVTRYHSLVIDPATLPSCLRPTAWSEGASSKALLSEREIMAVVHREYPSTIGVQFHPESIMTPHGKTMLRNFLDGCWETRGTCADAPRVDSAAFYRIGSTVPS